MIYLDRRDTYGNAKVCSLKNLKSLIRGTWTPRLKILHGVDPSRTTTETPPLLRTQLPTDNVTPKPFWIQYNQIALQ